MQTYDENELLASIEAGEKRLAEVRQRRRRERRRVLLGLLALLIVVPLATLAGLYASRAPQAPLFVVTWPNPKIAQVVAPGQTLLARPGNPWTISVTNASRWDITWRADGIEASGPEFVWSPDEGGGEIVARCRPIVNDWTASLSFLWPTREITLRCVVARPTSFYGRSLQAPVNGVWVYPHVFAAGDVAWDERALPLLASAIPTLPESSATAGLAPVNSVVTDKLWQLVSSFEGVTDEPSKNGTFAALHGNDIEAKMPIVGAQIVRVAPQVSVKFVVRLDKDPPEGIVRLDFDGKRERQAWLKQPGAVAGEPLEGWEDGDLSSG